MKNQIKARMNDRAVSATNASLEGVRRATGNEAFVAPPPPEVAAIAHRRQFSAGERQRILAAADQCKEPGEIGALLRKEGIYSSHLANWRKQRAAAEREALVPKKRGRKADPALAETRRVDLLERECDRLRRELAKSNLIIDVQKKVSTLLGLLKDEAPDGKS
jgi:transposase-like protein